MATIKEKYVKYFIDIEKDSVSTFKYLETEVKEYDPLLEYDEEDNWQLIDEIPSDVYFIKEVATTYVDTETSETKTLIYTYYYSIYEKEVEEPVDPGIIKKGTCVNCQFCVSGTTRFSKYDCNEEHHVIKNYVTGTVIPGHCNDYNRNGECPYYVEIEVPETAEETSEEDSESGE